MYVCMYVCSVPMCVCVCKNNFSRYKKEGIVLWRWKKREKGRGKSMMVSKWQREENYVWVRKHKGPSLHSILPITFVILQWWCCQRLYYSVIIGQPSWSSLWPLNRLVKIVSVWEKKEIDFDFWGHGRTEQQKVLWDGEARIIWNFERRSGCWELGSLSIWESLRM